MSSDPFLDALNAQASTSPPARNAFLAMAGIPQGSVPSGDLSPVADRIAAVEGTGRNPRSTAEGVGQFTNPTWVSTYRRHFGDDGASDQQILAKRSDPAFARNMLDLLVQDNAQALQSRGHATTPGNIYLANHFGVAGAHQILSADPSTPIEKIVGSQVVAANPQIAGKTAGDIVAWTAQRMRQDQSAARDPYREALADTASAAHASDDANDPYLQVLNHAMVGHDAALPNAALAQASIGAGGGSSARDPDIPVGSGGPNSQGQTGGTGRLLASLDPAFDSIVNGTNYMGNVQDRMAGLVHGAAAIPETMMDAAAWVTDRAGAPKSADTLRRWAGNLDNATANLAHDPNSNNFAVGKFGGEVAALAPIAEVAPLTAASKAGKVGNLAAMLARYGDMAGQGAAAGALTSKGENVGEKALTGAVLAPALGAAVDTIAPTAIKLAEGAAKSRIIKAVTDRLAAGDGNAAAAVEAPAATQTIRKGSDLAGWTDDEIAQGWRRDASGNTEFALEGTTPKAGVKIDVARPGEAFPGDRPATAGTPGAKPASASSDASPEVSAYVDAYMTGQGRGSSADDLKMQQFAANHASEIEKEFARRAAADQPAPEGAAKPNPAANPAEIAQALGSSGARSGIEATTDLPPDVADHYARLRVEGVPPDQALREADITAAGAKPTIAAVTRNPEEQAATWEGAKQATPEGRALSAQIAENNAAVLAKVQGLVEDHGGVPYQGEAAQTAATSLAKASDAERQRVTDLYARAAQEGGAEATASPVPLNLFFKTPEAKAPVTSEGRAFVTGMRRQLAAVTDNGEKPVTAADLERLRQSANSAYNPTGKEVNSLIGQFKAAIDERFDEIGKASVAYRAARAAHKNWAAAYENPEGVSKLIRRDAQGNFAHSDNWRSAEGFVSSTADKQFVQVVRQLKANGDTRAIARLKASVLQRAYEKATSNATDRLGNSTISGKRFFDTLNGVGTTKLQAIFSPPELAQIASIGRAARALNEAVPGTVNSSNTASALAKALMGHQPSGKAKATRTAMRIGGHVVGAATGHLGGNVAVEGAHIVAKAIGERSNAAKLAAALRESMDPATARAAQRSQAKRMAEGLRRHALAKAAAKKTSPVTGAIEGQRK